MAPLVSIVGKSKSGKTTFIRRLIPELKKRGYRVATIKHAQEINLEPGKDSQHHLEAGSSVTAVAAPGQVVVIKPVSPDASPEEVARLIGDDYDIILVEGYKRSDLPKIEIHQAQNGPCLEGLKKLMAMVTDEPVEKKVRQFSFDDVKGVADLLEEGFIKPQKNRLSLFVNGKQVPLMLFPRQIITSVLLAIGSSLKGIKDISSMDIYLRQ